jgi:hypothetical protein
MSPDHEYGYDVSLNPAPVVEAGKQYEIRLSADESLYASQALWFGGATFDDYPGGEFSYWDGADWATYDGFEDLAFQTYVTPDTIAPKVDAVNPVDGAKGVARGFTVTANFSEAVQATTLTSAHVQLFSPKRQHL